MSPSTEPYKEEKYKALMDGLECTTQSLSQVLASGSRFDADYYSKMNLSVSQILNTVGNKTIGEYGGILDCSAFYPAITGYYSHDRNNIPFLRVNEINNGLILITDETVFLPESVIEENSKTIAKAYPGDIIIAKGGNTLAKVGLVTDEFPVYATCRDVIILRTDRLDGINKYYLWAFLHSSYGQSILWRSASQTGQPHLTLPAITKIKVPTTGLIQKTIEILYQKSVDCKNQSMAMYSFAENILATTLGIQNIQHNPKNFSIKQFSNSFQSTGRFDAEYYQLEYDRYSEFITSSSNGYALIKNEFEQITEKCERTNREYPYVEIGDIDVSTGAASYNTISTVQLPANAKIMTKKGDILVSTVRPNRGAVAILDSDNLLVSGAFTVLRQKGSYKKEVLQTLLRTKLYRDWLLRYNVGTSYPVIKDDDVLNMPIPLFDADIQNAIEIKVQESVALRKQSSKLLEYAKKAVEMAIEQGEDTALAWLKEKVNV